MGFLRILGTRRARIAFNVVGSVVGLGVAVLTTRHFVQNGWPLRRGERPGRARSRRALPRAPTDSRRGGGSGCSGRTSGPGTLALAAAGGAATVTGLALPGRADEVVRITVVRKFPGKRAGIGSICLSLFLLGLIDNAALTPLAALGAGIAAPTGWVQAGLIVIAVAGVLAGAVVGFLPWLVASSAGRAHKSVRWLGRARGGTEGGCAGLGPRRRLVGVAGGRRLRPARRALGAARRSRSRSASSAPPRPPPRCRSLPRAASPRPVPARGSSSRPGSTPPRRPLSPWRLRGSSCSPVRACSC